MIANKEKGRDVTALFESYSARCLSRCYRRIFSSEGDFYQKRIFFGGKSYLQVAHDATFTFVKSFVHCENLLTWMTFLNRKIEHFP